MGGRAGGGRRKCNSQNLTTLTLTWGEKLLRVRMGMSNTPISPIQEAALWKPGQISIDFIPKGHGTLTLAASLFLKAKINMKNFLNGDWQMFTF